MSSNKSDTFKYTRKLVRIAIDDGMTQSAIAKLCRVSQGVVSNWSNGEKKATLNSIDALLVRYGNKLRKMTASVYCRTRPYYDLDHDVIDRIKSMDVDVGSISEDDKVYIDNLHKLLNSKKCELDIDTELPSGYEDDITRVEAPVIFRYTFQKRFKMQKLIKRYSSMRLIIHNLGNEQLLPIVQYRRRLNSTQRLKELETYGRYAEHIKCQIEKSEKEYFEPPLPLFPMHVDTCNDDSASWDSMILRRMKPKELVEEIEPLLAKHGSIISGHDLAAFPFLLKKSLLEAGLPVAGVKTISASC